MKTQRGFTLIEVLIVLVISSILAAIIIPQIQAGNKEIKAAKLHQAKLNLLVPALEKDSELFQAAIAPFFGSKEEAETVKLIYVHKTQDLTELYVTIRCEDWDKAQGFCSDITPVFTAPNGEEAPRGFFMIKFLLKHLKFNPDLPLFKDLNIT